MPTDQLTAAEISRLANVTRATVSNWRRRHTDFPRPSGGSETNPTYDRREVEAWLDARGQLPERSAADELEAGLRGCSTETIEALAVTLAAVAGATRQELDRLRALPPDELIVQPVMADVAKGAESSADKVALAEVLKSALNTLRTDGAAATFEVVDKYAETSADVRGTHSTPDEISDLMAELATHGVRATSALDPACGGGGLLTATAARLKDGAHVYGQDLRMVAAAQTEARLRAQSPTAALDVRSGDSLRHDAFTGLTVDTVVCNPPYGDRDWGHDELTLDQRWEYGVPPRAEPELAWIQHALAHLNKKGHAVLLLPPATASRSSGRRIRAGLVRRGALRAVIALPSGIAVPYHIGLHLWVLRQPEQVRTDQDIVLFVDTTGSTTGAPRTAPAKHAFHETVMNAWKSFTRSPASFTGTPGRARAVPAIDLLDEIVDLTPARHVHAPHAVTPQDAAAHVTDLMDRLRHDVTALADASRTGSWTPATGSGRNWRTATVADLLRGGALSVHRGVRAPSRDVPPAKPKKRPVLRARDLISGNVASGTLEESPLTDPMAIEIGDVLLAQAAPHRGAAARVADERDAGALLGNGVHLLRTDPERLDPWFLVGFVAAADNISQATTGTSSPYLVANRLRVPLLPLNEQRAYGEAFRQMHTLREAARRTERQARETADALTNALTGGALLPPHNTS